MRRQSGLSLIGLMIVSGLLVFVAIIGFKLLPAYIEYFTIKRVISDIARAPDTRGGNAAEIRRAFDARANIDNIRSIKGSDVEIQKSGNGVILSASYSVQIPLFSNVSACIDFVAEGGGN